MRVGITGATSGLGIRLVELLVEKKYTIKALVRKSSNKKKLEQMPVIFNYGDITQPDTLIDFIKDIDVCFHLAAQVNYSTKQDYYSTNVSGTRNVCEAIIHYNKECHLIHCSTISTLKVRPYFRFLSSLYAISKYEGEKIVVSNMNNHILKATIVYPGLIFGKYDRSFIPRAIDTLRKNKVKLFSGGESKAPCIYVDELCDLFIRCAMNKISIGKRYISVRGLDIGMHEFIKIIADKLNLSFSDKVYPKQFFFLLGLLFEYIYRLLGKKEKPPIYRTLVNNLSNNFNTYKKKYDDPFPDLGWKQETSKEKVEQQLDYILSDFYNG